MKKRFLLVAATVAVSFAAITSQAIAQQRGQAPELDAATLTTEYADNLQTTLTLTDDQKSKVYDIYFAIAEENIPAIKEQMSQRGQGDRPQGGQRSQGGGGQGGGGERPQRSESGSMQNPIFAMVYAQEGDAAIATETKMKAILSDDQYTKWKEIVEESKTRQRPQRQ